MTKARGICRGLFSSFAFVAVAMGTGCAPRDPAAVAAAADARAHTGIYTWLAQHDPSAVLVIGLDAASVRAIAPSARIFAGSGAARDCARALRDRALLAELVRVRTRERDRAVDCGYALYQDDAGIVVAPR